MTFAEIDDAIMRVLAERSASPTFDGVTVDQLRGLFRPAARRPEGTHPPSHTLILEALQRLRATKAIHCPGGYRWTLVPHGTPGV